jgi:hypothetical protein
MFGNIEYQTSYTRMLKALNAHLDIIAYVVDKSIAKMYLIFPLS